jgi:hypothetical protein
MVGKYTRIAKKLDKGIATFDEVREMGSKGGLTNKARHGNDIFVTMAKKSNEVQKQNPELLHQNRHKAQKLSVISRNRNKKLREENEGIDI